MKCQWCFHYCTSASKVPPGAFQQAFDRLERAEQAPLGWDERTHGLFGMDAEGVVRALQECLGCS